MIVEFNRRPLHFAGRIEAPPEDIVKSTPSLWQADLETALLYGGELTRAALGAMVIRGDKRYVTVDTKVHMLMPGQCPAIPGWHTDGAPREAHEGGHHPLGYGPPDLAVQEQWEAEGIRPRFHLLVTGTGCLPEFVTNRLSLEVYDQPDSGLYRLVTGKIETGEGREGPVLRSSIPTCMAVEWDWWHLHQGVLATKREWRYLIRVTESDHHEPMPRSRLSEIIRTQQMVYTPQRFGW